MNDTLLWAIIGTVLKSLFVDKHASKFMKRLVTDASRRIWIGFLVFFYFCVIFYRVECDGYFYVFGGYHGYEDETYAMESYSNLLFR